MDLSCSPEWFTTYAISGVLVIFVFGRRMEVSGKPLGGIKINRPQGAADC
jgi:hypothetical protein